MNVTALSYDSIELLRHFADRKGIDYPMLSDPDSDVIRAFGILNDNFPTDHAWYGVPFPGVFVIDENGDVKSKYFEEDHRHRYTASNIIVSEFGETSGVRRTEVETNHLNLTYWGGDSVLRFGNRTSLVLDILLKPGMHVYAPEVKGGYKPVNWEIENSPGLLVLAPEYPSSERLHLLAIDETVPVYHGKFRIERDLMIGLTKKVGSLLSAKQELVLTGAFKYQACDDKVCYPSSTIPLKWIFQIEAHDDKRAPERLRRK